MNFPPTDMPAIALKCKESLCIRTGASIFLCVGVCLCVHSASLPTKRLLAGMSPISALGDAYLFGGSPDAGSTCLNDLYALTLSLLSIVVPWSSLFRGCTGYVLIASQYLVCRWKIRLGVTS